MDIFIHNSVTATNCTCRSNIISRVQQELMFDLFGRISVVHTQNFSNSHPVTDRTQITGRRVDYKIMVTHPTLL